MNPYQVGLLLLVEEHLFRVDYFSSPHPQVFFNDFMLAEYATVLKLDEF